MKTQDLRTFRSVLVVATLLIALSPFGLTQNTANSTAVTVPHLIKFSGVLKSDAGAPKAGIVGITFAFYKDQQGGAPLWLETQNVQADANGRYTAMLGATKPDGLPMEFFSSNEARWVGVRLQGQNEQPRVLLVSAPYALKAADAETLGGKPLSAFQLAAPQSSSSGATQNALPPADQANEITCASGSACQTGFIPQFSSNGGRAKVDNSVITQSGTTIGIAGNLSLSGNLNSKGEVLGQTGSFTGNTSGAVVSVGNQNASGIAVLGVNTNTNGGGVGVQGNGPNGVIGNGTTRGVTGTGLIGVEGDATGTNSIGVSGTGSTGMIATGVGNNSTGVAGTGGFVGVEGTTSSTSSTSVGVFGQATASSGGATGVVGESSSGNGVFGTSFAKSGTTYGVLGINSNPSGVSAGVEAESFATSGTTWGLVGATHSPNGIGAVALGDGESNVGFGIIGCCAVGVWGDTGQNGNTPAGVVATADDAKALFAANNSPSGVMTAAFLSEGAGAALVAGGFKQSCSFDNNGDLFCQGSKSAVVPVDSGRRQVALYAVEAPQNWFEDFGSGKLANGLAMIALEPTFAQTVDATSDYHVFLTPQGDCRGIYVSNKSAAGFEVHELGGGQSNVAFEYRIVALRRGYENVRLDDKTEMVAKWKAGIPKPLDKPGPPVLPSLGPGAAANLPGNVQPAKTHK